MFLTTKEAGLGEHTDDPEAPGHCYCKALYGERDCEALGYLVSIRNASKEEKEKKRRQAEATTAILYEGEKPTRQERRMAEEAMKKNKGGAAWGCRWFKEWKKNAQGLAVRGCMVRMHYCCWKIFCHSPTHYGPPAPMG